MKKTTALLSIFVLIFSIFSLDAYATTNLDSTYSVTVDSKAHDYLCSAGTIIECCGDDTCVSALGGERYSTGEGPVELLDSSGDVIATYYCANDADWTTDLDTKGEASCEAYGFKWTGSLCCGEADDPNEFYNDVEDGCWDSSEVQSGENATLKYDVVNYNGQFYGCKLDAKNFIDDNNVDLGNIEDSHSTTNPKAKLIQKKGYCDTLGDDFYCSYTEEWKTGVKPGMHLSEVQWDDLEAGTCEDDSDCDFDKPQCVDGKCTGCKESACESGHTGGKSVCCEKSKGAGTHFSQYDDKNFECWSSCDNSPQCLYNSDCPYGKPKCVNGACVGCVNSDCGDAGGMCCPGTGFGTHLGYDAQANSYRYDDSHYQCWTKCSIEKECCEDKKCFDGQKCVNDQAGNAASKPTKGYRCVDGKWIEASAGSDPLGTTSGYCPLKDQCLVSLQGDSNDNNNPGGNPQCITTGQYIGDDYCDKGEWTSRTKLVASSMLSLPLGKDHILFCGDYEETLNYLDYDVKGNKLAREYVEDYTNHNCVLIYDGEIVFGTSLNHPSTEQYFMDSLYVDCSGVTFDSGYKKCRDSNTKYNMNTNSIIYSKNEFGEPQSNLYFDNLKDTVQDLLDKIEAKIKPFDDSVFTRGIKKFKKIYINQKGNKKILAVMEGGRNIVAKYTGFDTDICELTGAFNKYYEAHYFGGDESRVHCFEDEEEEGTYYVLAEGSGLGLTNINPEEIWPDLTAKLRLE